MTGGSPGKGQRPVVLMVDNNLGDLDLTRIALEEQGIDVQLDTAGDGKEAQGLLRRMLTGERPLCCLLLLDLNMPRMDGRELLGWVRAQPGLKGLPVVILTSSHLPRDRTECLALGATDYWVKPASFVDHVQQMARVREYLPG